MEELHQRRKIVTKDTSRRCRQIVGTEDGEAYSIVVQLESTPCFMEEKYKSVMDAKDDDCIIQTPNTKIQKVLTVLKPTEDSKKYFEPRVVSIGPYHHGKVGLEPAEKIKLKFTKQFIIDNCNEPIEVLYNKIFIEIKKLRACYDEEPTKEYDDTELAWMLFVDGCFVLNYIDYYVNRMSTDSFNISKCHDLLFMRLDLFLLENQIPFPVLKLLMREGSREDKWAEIIEDFIKKYINPPERKARKQWLPSQWWQQEEEDNIPEEKPAHLLDFLRRRLIGKTIQKKTYQGRHRHPFRIVTELTAAGIRLKTSETNYINDVSFHPHCIYGDLKLPPIIVDDSTKTKFLNLIAYEMSPGVINGLEVTSYICFLNSLIDHPSDVQLLREAYIIDSYVSSNEEVANLFNAIGTNLVPNSNLYEGVKMSIQNQYDEFRMWKSLGAEFIYKHFRSPWSVLAFIWAVLLLIINASTKIKPLVSS